MLAAVNAIVGVFFMPYAMVRPFSLAYCCQLLLSVVEE